VGPPKGVISIPGSDTSVGVALGGTGVGVSTLVSSVPLEKKTGKAVMVKSVVFVSYLLPPTFMQ